MYVMNARQSTYTFLGSRLLQKFTDEIRMKYCRGRGNWEWFRGNGRDLEH